ncbi:hypothetical protein NDU88_003533 [Pleurodeles waltl]|uniref:Uncharacterized protein n=1 Tax=Pleurodeles waltl TaxID=8319 RepID=A0AAV7T627_PLEWA|nr:hypothetical protein NDU88_003533 [Pleurodeles waltl]
MYGTEERVGEAEAADCTHVRRTGVESSATISERPGEALLPAVVPRIKVWRRQKEAYGQQRREADLRLEDAAGCWTSDPDLRQCRVLRNQQKKSREGVEALRATDDRRRAKQRDG